MPQSHPQGLIHINHSARGDYKMHTEYIYKGEDMDSPVKLQLLTDSLERCAESLGDITPAVMKTYYQSFPEAFERFNTLYPNEHERLEGEMVEQVLFCLMRWYESPMEIKITIMSTVFHHIETLKVDAAMFTGLITAVCDTVVGTIPADKPEELAVWEELDAILASLVEQSGVMITKRDTRAVSTIV